MRRSTLAQPSPRTLATPRRTLTSPGRVGRGVAAFAVTVAALSMPVAAQARTQRPVRPPLPNPMPQIVRMATNDPMANGFAGYYDGAVIHVIDPRDKFTVRHELGHAFDAQYMDAGERQRFATLLACDRYGCNGEQDLYWTTAGDDPLTGMYVTDPGSVSEKFADAYAACRSRYVIASDHVWETGYGYSPPTNRQHLRVCRMIANAAKDPGTPLDADGWR